MIFAQLATVAVHDIEQVLASICAYRKSDLQPEAGNAKLQTR
jgi:hypothetical protein